KLPPGHLMIASAGGLEVRRYWRWRPSAARQASEPRLMAEYVGFLEDSVRLQMRSDVPVGLYLSSGLDSTALLALMTKVTSAPVHTFSIGFEGGADSNETNEARETAERFGADHTEAIIGPGDYERYFERYLSDLEEPVGEEAAPAFYFLSA